MALEDPSCCSTNERWYQQEMTATTTTPTNVKRLHTPQFIRVDTVKRQTKRAFDRTIDGITKTWRKIPHPIRVGLTMGAFFGALFLACYAWAYLLLLACLKMGWGLATFYVLYYTSTFGAIFGAFAAYGD